MIADLLSLFSWAMFAFWIYAIAALNLYRGWLTGTLTWRMPAYWFAIIGMVGFLIIDWFMNLTVFALFCWQRPQATWELVTTRMARYREDPATDWYRRGVADFTCGLLNVFNFDNTKHC